jgi:hypothetical protein
MKQLANRNLEKFVGVVGNGSLQCEWDFETDGAYSTVPTPENCLYKLRNLVFVEENGNSWWEAEFSILGLIPNEIKHRNFLGIYCGFETFREGWSDWSDPLPIAWGDSDFECVIGDTIREFNPEADTIIYNQEPIIFYSDKC